jgi:hypothetical protein
LRSVVILGWVAAMTAELAIVVSIEASTGYTGIAIVVSGFVVLPLAVGRRGLR